MRENIVYMANNIKFNIYNYNTKYLSITIIQFDFIQNLFLSHILSNSLFNVAEKWKGYLNILVMAPFFASFGRFLK